MRWPWGYGKRLGGSGCAVLRHPDCPALQAPELLHRFEPAQSVLGFPARLILAADAAGIAHLVEQTEDVPVLDLALVGFVACRHAGVASGGRKTEPQVGDTPGQGVNQGHRDSAFGGGVIRRWPLFLGTRASDNSYSSKTNIRNRTNITVLPGLFCSVHQRVRESKHCFNIAHFRIRQMIDSDTGPHTYALQS